MAQQMTQYDKMTKSPLVKLIVSLGIPTTISMLVTSLYNDKCDTLLSNVQLYLDSIIKRSLDVRKDNRDNFMFEVYRKNLLK